MKRKRMLWAAIAAAALAVALLAGFAGADGEGSVYTGRQIYKNSAPAVFYLKSQREGGAQSTGTGFLISADGLALTAAHVVKDAEFVTAELESGLVLTGVQVLYADEAGDVAVLRLPDRLTRDSGDYAAALEWYSAAADKSAASKVGAALVFKYPFIKTAEAAPQSGEDVYALGYPLKTAKIITQGIISSPAAVINGNTRALLTAPLSNGMSGGPVIDEHGRAVGIVSGTLKTMTGVGVSPTLEQMITALEKEEG